MFLRRRLTNNEQHANGASPERSLARWMLVLILISKLEALVVARGVGALVFVQMGGGVGLLLGILLYVPIV